MCPDGSEFARRGCLLFLLILPRPRVAGTGGRDGWLIVLWLSDVSIFSDLKVFNFYFVEVRLNFQLNFPPVMVRLHGFVAIKWLISPAIVDDWREKVIIVATLR